MMASQHHPRPPAELRLWTWLSMALLLLFFGLGAIMWSRWGGAIVLLSGAIVQVVFGAMTATNRDDLAERLARYYAQRPVVLGGFVLNRYPLSWRLQGLAMIILGIGLAIGAVVLVR
jgi:hypothetical protein